MNNSGQGAIFRHGRLLRHVAVLAVLCAGIARADGFVAGGACRVFDYDTNFPAGHPVQTRYIWRGACDAAGLASGPGELMAYWNGNLDETSWGLMQRGRLEGHAVTVSSSGLLFDGNYHAGRRNGFGALSGVNAGGLGFRYEGNFVDGAPDGVGTETFSNGDRYTGGFSGWQRSGHGVMQWADGSRYVGEFRNDHASGPGLLMRASPVSGRILVDVVDRRLTAGPMSR